MARSALAGPVVLAMRATRAVAVTRSPVPRRRSGVAESRESVAGRLYVDVVNGGFAPGRGDLGTLEPDGTCRRVPGTLAGRQARYDAIVAAGRWPQLCRVPARP